MISVTIVSAKACFFYSVEKLLPIFLSSLTEHQKILDINSMEYVPPLVNQLALVDKVRTQISNQMAVRVDWSGYRSHKQCCSRRSYPFQGNLL